MELLDEVLKRLSTLEAKFEKVIIHERESKIELKYLDIDEACTYMGIKKSSLYNMMRAGMIPYTRIGTQRRFLVEDLDRIILKQYKKVRPSLINA